MIELPGVGELAAPAGLVGESRATYATNGGTPTGLLGEPLQMNLFGEVDLGQAEAAEGEMNLNNAIWPCIGTAAQLCDRIALHEAGHAVVVYHYHKTHDAGWLITGIHAHEESAGGNQCEYEVPRLPFWQQKPRVMVIAIAGSAAEVLETGRCGFGPGKNDVAKCWRRLGMDGDYSFLEWCRHISEKWGEAEAVIQGQLAALRALKAGLLAQGDLSQAQAESILAEKWR